MQLCSHTYLHWYICLCDFILVDDLSILTITSKATRNLIEGYCAVRPILKKSLIQRLHACSPYLPLPVEKQSVLVQTFSKLGIYIYMVIVLTIWMPVFLTKWNTNTAGSDHTTYNSLHILPSPSMFWCRLLSTISLQSDQELLCLPFHHS